jgi:hypothetical protein
MASRVRKLDVSLAVAACAVSFGITLSAIILVRHHAPLPARPPHTQDPVSVGAGVAGSLSPAALDRQWVTYSDRSTCADRAGGDGVSAVRLSPTQVAWFFSDSSLGPAGPHIGLSHQSGFVHNLVVMQTIRGRRSRLVTITGGQGCTGPGRPGHARSIVNPADAGGAASLRYWAGDGLRVGARALRFYTSYQPGALVPVGTVIAGYAIRQLVRAGEGPAFGAVIHPGITQVPSFVPPGGGTPVIWGAALVTHRDTVYIYGWQSPGPQLAIRCYLARVAAGRLTEVSAWRYYVGRGRWAASQLAAQPITAGPDLTIDTGFSVITAAGHYWLIEQAGGFGSPEIDAYPGPAPWGPFSTAAAIVLYRAPGIGLTAADHFQIMYEARAEPALSTGRTLVVSYNVNSLAVTAGCLPLSAFTNAVIQPRFIAVPRAEFADAPGTAPVSAAVGAGAGYPRATGKHEPQFFDSWTYRGGCPPLGAVQNISISSFKNKIRIRWRTLGPGVRYQIYLRSPGAVNYLLLRTVDPPSVTLSNLSGGRYQVLIVPENIHQRTGPDATVTFKAP